MIYYAVASLLLAAMFPRPQTRRVLAWLGAAMILAIGGLRFEVGTDWESYQDVFNFVAQGEPYGDLREENGFLALISVFQTFSSSYPAFVFVLFLISFALKLYAINKFRADMTSALVVYFFSVFLIYDVNGLRQGLALGFVMCAGWYAVQSKAWAFIGAMALAISMHKVAVVAVPMYWMASGFLLQGRAVYQQYLIAAAAVIACYLLSLSLAQTDASAYFELINLTDRYFHYLDNFETTFSPVGLGSLQRLFILALALAMYGQLACPPRVAALLVNTYLAATLIFFTLSFNIEFMARVSYYYKVFDIVLIGLMFSSLRGLRERLAFIAVLGTLLFGSIFQLLSIPDGGLLPYKLQFLE